MRPRTLKSALLILTLGLSFGCGSDAEGPDTLPSNPVEGATLAVAVTGTLGRVDVEGLPAPAGKRRETSYEVVLHTDGAEEIRLPLDHDASAWFFHAPFHPVTPNEGGSMTAIITDGSAESAPQPLSVSSLPEAPGTFAAVVEKAREYIEQRATWAGTSIDELKATAVGEVDPVLAPLKLAQLYLDSDEDPHDLTELAANGDGFFSAEQVDLLDRVFGYFDLASLLQMRIDAFAAEESPAPSFQSAKGAPGACIDARIRIETAEELSQRMIQSKVAEIGVDPESDAGKIMGFGARAMTGLSLGPGLVGPVAGGSAAVLATVQAAVGFVAGTLPSYFVSITCEIPKREFNEDSAEMTTYQNVKVVAASTGWSAERSIASVAINAFGAYLSAADQGLILGSGFLRDLASVGIGTGADTFFEDTDIIEFCANQWTIDISDPDYCTAASLDGKLDVNIPFREVKPREAGADHLRVAAQKTKFGGREIYKDEPMQVKQIQVIPSPDEIYVQELGEDVSISAEIHNADVTALRWTPEAGAWHDGILGTDTNDGTTRTLRTPTEPSAYPFFVFIESLSRQGIRATGEPVRQGIVTVKNGSQPRIEIQPKHACIAPGETQQFDAIVTGVDDYTIHWEKIDGYGDIDQNGLYTSLSQGTSNATIKATVNEVENLFDTASVDVRTCVCSVDVTITGDSTWRAGSSDVAYLVSDLGDLQYQFFFEIEDGSGHALGASIIGDGETVLSPRPGDTGTWEAGFVYIEGDQSWNSVWDEEIPLPAVSVTITELTDEFMEGRFHGNAFQLDGQNEITSLVGVDVKFRAGRWDGGAWPCASQ